MYCSVVICTHIVDRCPHIRDADGAGRNPRGACGGFLGSAVGQPLQLRRRNMKAWLTISLYMAAGAVFPIGSALANEREATAYGAPPSSAVCSLEDANGGRFRAGDRISLTEYERLDPDPNDRLPAKSIYPSYRLRAEVSGDFDIAEDGTISVPILGRFIAAGKTVEELRDAVASAFEATLGHVGVITIAIAEHQPIYVDGVVKNPGAYKFTPGLTALHAVSLSGGYEDIKLESHQVLLSTLQEAETGEQAKASLQRLLAREAVLRAELDTTVPSPPPALLDLVGDGRAKELLAEQVAERKTVIETNAIEQERQLELIDSARQLLDTRINQVKVIDAAIEERGDRVKKLKVMMTKGVSSQDFYQIAQAEYLDTLARKQDVAAGIQQGQAQLNDAQMTLAKLKLDAKFALQHEISDLELQIAQQAIVYRSHVTSANIIDADPNVSPGARQLAYELVRRTGSRVATYRVDGACLLEPGDLVRVFAGDRNGVAEAVNRQPESPDRGSSAAYRGPGMDQAHVLDFVVPQPTSAQPAALW
jgi:protein involved in polysaccharide export with SLBB domain